MKNIVLKYGLLSGVISAGLMAIFMPLCMNGTITFDNGVLLGYSAIVLAFLLVFFGIRMYREQNGGMITFGKAFQVGILITLISCAFYVTMWEIYYFGFDPQFEEKYAEVVVTKAREKGVTAAELAKVEQEMADFARDYKKPLFNIGMTFMEPFPVGLIVTLVSAAILRRKTASPEPVRATA